jgi:DNA-directed RNA polymerase specialized sigma subunit|tara:strand:- start:3337 stop:3717 length:381 start_codon:yes stop_codon:yes gene_type:complete
MSKREILRDPVEYAWLFDLTNTKGQPSTAIESIQQTAAHKEPRISKEERFLLREAVIEAVESLDAEDLWIVNALLFERLSLRQVERILGTPKTTLARKRDKILVELREKLLENTLVREYINGGQST